MVRPKATSSVVHILRSVGARGVHEQGISRLAHRLVYRSNNVSIVDAGAVSYCSIWQVGFESTTSTQQFSRHLA